MRKFLSLFILCVFLISGCSQNVVYKTMYIDNCSSTQLREKPSNDSTVLDYIKCGEAVSYEKDGKNGYSKVAYKGVNGYVLSTMLSEQKPVETDSETTLKKSEPTTSDKTYDENEYDYLISHLPDDYIEEYVSTYVRPLYNQINENINSCTEVYYDGATSWYEGGRTLCKMEIPQGIQGYNKSRQYYYDVTDGQLIFAFVFSGSQEYRLYFEDGKLVRYIGADSVIVNNPTITEALEMAEHVLNEAY